MLFLVLVGFTTASGRFAEGAIIDAADVDGPLSVAQWTANGHLQFYEGSLMYVGDAAITLGGSAQPLFSSIVPQNGFEVSNPDPSNDLWISDSATAAANGEGSYRVAPNGGTYTTPPSYRPVGIVSVYGAVTGQKITARWW